MSLRVYCEPKDEVIIGDFLSHTEQVPIERIHKGFGGRDGNDSKQRYQASL